MTSPSAPLTWTTPASVVRHPQNPILAPNQIPYPASLVFNAGVTRFEGRYVMLFRNDYGSTEEDWRPFREGRAEAPPALRTTLGLAHSHDGIHWEVAPQPCWEIHDEEVYRVYDPRITVIEGKAYVCFAMDTRHGIRGGIACTRDFSRFDILSLSVPDNRNMVLFPEKIGGGYFRLERPFPIYSRGRDRFDIWSGRSPDLRYWGDHELVLGVEHLPYANDKIGPAAPPIKTRKGWLVTLHAVWRAPSRNLGGWERSWHKTYYAGLMLLDLENPAKVIGVSRQPLIVPEASYERQGFRNDVIFPCGMIEEPSGEVKIFYGAADTVIAVASSTVEELLRLCE